MFTFMSPPSDEPVALLWGSNWWIAGWARPVGFSAISEAAGALLAAFGENRPPRLRLVFQPWSLQSHAVACPNGGRTALRDALQEQFPALDAPGCTWGYEPIAGGPNGGSTLLHLEGEPGLIPLCAALVAAGIAVTGAWPLASVLNLVPDDLPDAAGVVTALAADQQLFVYRHLPTGERRIETCNGDSVAPALSALVGGGRHPEGCLCYVVALDGVCEARVRSTGDQGDSSVRLLGWAELEHAARALARRHPNQLLPAAPWLTLDRVGWFIAAAALLASAWQGAALYRGSVLTRVEAAERITETEQLRRDIEEFSAGEAEATALRAKLDRERPGLIAAGALLRALAVNLPASVVLTDIRADRVGFEVAGGISGTPVTEGQWQRWRGELGNASTPWRVPEAGPAPTADFKFSGRWK